MDLVKKYKVTFDWWEAVLEIKDDEKTKNNMKDQLLFFMDGQDRINNENGDITQAYLKHITPHLIEESIEWEKDGVIDQIADDMYEGFLPIDGSFGIKLISIDHWEFDQSDILIEKCS